MFRSFFLSVALLWLLAAPVPAQECLTITPELAARAAKFATGGGHCGVQCKGCGCKGGSGYRGPDGKCVGWKNLARVCGAPPYGRCTRECTPVAEGCANHGAAATAIFEEAAPTAESGPNKPVRP